MRAPVIYAAHLSLIYMLDDMYVVLTLKMDGDHASLPSRSLKLGEKVKRKWKRKNM